MNIYEASEISYLYLSNIEKKCKSKFYFMHSFYEGIQLSFTIHAVSSYPHYFHNLRSSTSQKQLTIRLNHHNSILLLEARVLDLHTKENEYYQTDRPLSLEIFWQERNSIVSYLRNQETIQETWLGAYALASLTGWEDAVLDELKNPHFHDHKAAFFLVNLQSPVLYYTWNEDNHSFEFLADIFTPPGELEHVVSLVRNRCMEKEGEFFTSKQIADSLHCRPSTVRNAFDEIKRKDSRFHVIPDEDSLVIQYSSI